MWGSTKLKPLVETHRTVRHRRNGKILRALVVAACQVTIGYHLFYLSKNPVNAAIIVGAFLLGYTLAWFKHCKIPARIKKTIEHLKAGHYTFPQCWRMSEHSHD